MVQHLQDLWIGMGKVIDNENLSVVSPKIKNLSNLVQAYARRTSSQVEWQAPTLGEAPTFGSFSNGRWSRNAILWLAGKVYFLRL
jgi:phage baseplate assembly protein gpV